MWRAERFIEKGELDDNERAKKILQLAVSIMTEEKKWSVGL